jgi:hypothetical protein
MNDVKAVFERALKTECPARATAVIEGCAGVYESIIKIE